jgi:hypothetical protein
MQVLKFIPNLSTVPHCASWQRLDFRPLFGVSVSISYYTTSNGNMDNTESTNEEFINRVDRDRDPATGYLDTGFILGFPVSLSKCWDGSQDSKMLLHAAFPT